MRWLCGLFFAAAALAQQYQIGADVGYGIYRNGTIFSATETVQAGIRNRFAAGVSLGWDFSNYVSAQFSYLYHDGHPFLQGPGLKVDIQGQSQALTIQGLFHFKQREQKWRPFVSGGIGGKDYVIAGPAPFPQPAPDLATLTTNDVWKVVFCIGGGVDYRIHKRVLIRAEVRDYLTTFPRQQIVPAEHNTARGIFQQITPMVGVRYVF